MKYLIATFSIKLQDVENTIRPISFKGGISKLNQTFAGICKFQNNFNVDAVPWNFIKKLSFHGDEELSNVYGIQNYL